MLIPIRYLVNGATIVQEQKERVVYWHVELTQHDILLAEGLCAESYLDTGNRRAFENAGVGKRQAGSSQRIWKASACAPLVLAGARLDSARRHLLERARRLGYSMTADPAPSVFAAGCVLPPEIRGRTLRFRLPPGACGVRLVSRSGTPAHRSVGSEDHRCLGIAISRVMLDGVTISLADARLSSGWHGLEGGTDAAPWRWTDGDAGLALAGVKILDLEVAMSERYWVGRRETSMRPSLTA